VSGADWGYVRSSLLQYVQLIASAKSMPPPWLLCSDLNGSTSIVLANTKFLSSLRARLVSGAASCEDAEKLISTMEACAHVKLSPRAIHVRGVDCGGVADGASDPWLAAVQSVKYWRDVIDDALDDDDDKDAGE